MSDDKKMTEILMEVVRDSLAHQNIINDLNEIMMELTHGIVQILFVSDEMRYDEPHLYWELKEKAWKNAVIFVDKYLQE